MPGTAVATAPGLCTCAVCAVTAARRRLRGRAQLERTFFGHLVATQDVGGDGIVPVDSATTGARTVNGAGDTYLSSCTMGAGALRIVARSIGLGVDVVDVWLAHLGSGFSGTLLSGDKIPLDASSVWNGLAALLTPCSHTNLVKNEDVLVRVGVQITKMTRSANGTADLPDGSYFGYGKSLVGRSLTYDPVEFFTGPSAAAACRQDGGHPDQISEYCHDYYVRNSSSRLRTVELAPNTDVRITEAPGSSTLVPAAATTLGERIALAHGKFLFQLQVTGSRVTTLHEVFVP